MALHSLNRVGGDGGVKPLLFGDKKMTIKEIAELCGVDETLDACLEGLQSWLRDMEKSDGGV